MSENDPAVEQGIQAELHREQTQIELIASENIVSRAVLEAQGSVLTNKYAEGYPGRRYYQGCAPSDTVETLAIERAKQLFGCGFANVQPHSGAQANGAVMMALLKPGDTIMGMSLAAGGHLTHGAPPAQSGKWFDAVQYGVRQDDHLVDFDEVERLAKEHKPKLIIAGGSAYPRHLDFARFRAICDEVGALLFVDMAHFAGLVAAGEHPTPFGHAHVVTTTTHKTLRGPRGGMVLTDDEAIAKKINSAVFPGLQGGPLMHVIAAKAVAFGEALKPEFKDYAKAVIANAQTLAGRLKERGADLVAGGTDTHLALVDLRPLGLTGKDADESLERAGITCNKNGVPFDPLPPMQTSGIRVGSPAGTTRGFGEAEFSEIADMVADVLDGLVANGPDSNGAVERSERARPRAVRAASRSTRDRRMRCPFCAHEDSQVKDSRPSEDGAAIRRRRQCEACGARFTTFERVQLRDLTVVKKDGKREPFDRDKLSRSINIACRKRGIDADRIDRLVSSIQRQLETRGDEVRADRHRRGGDGRAQSRSTMSPTSASPASTRISASPATSPKSPARSGMATNPRHRPGPPAAGTEYRQGGAGDAQFRADRDAPGRPARRLAQPRRRPVRKRRRCRARTGPGLRNVADAIADCTHGLRLDRPPPRPRHAGCRAGRDGQRHHRRSPGRSAILFGPERSGLETEDVALAQRHRHRPDQSRVRQPQPRPGGDPARL